MNYKYILSIAVLIAVIATWSVLQSRPWQVLGDVIVDGGTLSTTTPQVADLRVLCGGTTTSTGILDSVSFLNMSAGDLLLLDATTSNVTKRTGNTATNSLILAWFPPGTGTSTVHFGTQFNNGLMVDYSTGVGTSSISYLCQG